MTKPLRVAVAGMGTMGRLYAGWMQQGRVPGIEKVCLVFANLLIRQATDRHTARQTGKDLWRLHRSPRQTQHVRFPKIVRCFGTVRQLVEGPDTVALPHKFMEAQAIQRPHALLGKFSADFTRLLQIFFHACRPHCEITGRNGSHSHIDTIHSLCFCNHIL